MPMGGLAPSRCKEKTQASADYKRHTEFKKITSLKITVKFMETEV